MLNTILKACMKSSLEITRLMTLPIPGYMQLQVHVLLLKQVLIIEHYLYTLFILLLSVITYTLIVDL